MARETRLMMGMPITVEVVGAGAEALIDAAFATFAEVDARFSPYRDDSEVSALNAGRLARRAASAEMAEVLEIAEEMRQASDGYFDIARPEGGIDPSGVVKGWAILKVARQIAATGVEHYYVDAGGDIQTGGRDAEGRDWVIGIRNPFDAGQIIKGVTPRGRGIATSGSYARGAHIYDPHFPGRPIEQVVSLTVIGPDVLAADLYATAGFAMGPEGIHFIEAVPQLEGYAVRADGTAQQTSGFRGFVAS
ncbi:FAD:protein FMN transferase [Acidimangrovimonas pyrenivorans]|uniref:FAD:protein FMN transferase n=1 Tax=Acidimangrovimonas pyrenivorans TaxID=2030798 RepID=A0ABV7ABM3_9RHOB